MKTHSSPDCQKQKIHELAEFADNEYYVASVTTDGQRKQRGLSRVQAVIIELENLKASVVCQACLEDISCQLQLQGKALKALLSQRNSFLGMARDTL